MPDLAASRLIIVGIYYHPEETGIAPYTTGLAEHLTSLGAEVTVLAGIPHYPMWKPFDGYRRRLRASERINGVEVRRVRTYMPPRQTALNRALYEASFLAHALTLPSCRKPDAVFGVVPNLSGGVVAALASRSFGCSMGLLVQDLTGPAAQQSGMPGGEGRVAELVTRLEGWTLRQAAKVAIVSPGFRNYVESFGVDGTDVVEVPNWSRLPESATPVRDMRRRLGWEPGQQVVLHAGNMGLKQGLEAVVRAARLAQSASPDVRFVLLGDGNQRRHLERLAEGLSNLDILDPLPFEDFADALRAADVLLVNERSTVTDMSLPSKITSYYLAGRPVVAATQPQSATARLVQESKGGLLVPADDSAALLETLDRLRSDEGLALDLARAAASYAKGNFSQEAMLSRATEFVRSLTVE